VDDQLTAVGGFQDHGVLSRRAYAWTAATKAAAYFSYATPVAIPKFFDSEQDVQLGHGTLPRLGDRCRRSQDAGGRFERVLKINELHTITNDVVEAA
jgi:hypothetical protein